jgi:putative isomerase
MVNCHASLMLHTVALALLGTGAAVALMMGPPARQAQDATEISRLFRQHHVKQAVIKAPKGLLKYPYVVPSGPYFQLFDWDMYFMGVALSYDRVGQPVADSVKDFLEFVDANASDQGYTPREIAPDGVWALPEMCKPFLAQAALRASATMKRADWLRPSYTKLAHTLSFWENTRRSADGLFRWFNGVESGVDNNPAVSDIPAEATEGVDLQSYLFREYGAMALLAESLGNGADAASYRAKAENLKRLVQQKMWSEGDGMFLNVDSRTGQLVRIKTWTNLAPLWAGIATREQAQRMVQEHVLNPKEFWAAHGLRTLAADEPLYNPRSGYWRGPIWVISNYLVMHGLMNYGYDAPAQELAQKTIDLLVADLKATGGMNENYGPETGAPLAGGHFVSWDLLAEHMAEEATLHTDPTALERPTREPAGATYRGASRPPR